MPTYKYTYSGYVEMYDPVYNLGFTRKYFDSYIFYDDLVNEIIDYISDCESDTDIEKELDTFRAELNEHYTAFILQIIRGNYCDYQDSSTFVTESGLEYIVTIIVNVEEY